MKKEELYETLEDIDERFIDEADTVMVKKKTSVWMKWGATAACVCLVVGAVAANFNKTTDTGNHIQKWCSGFSADQYFMYAQQEEEVSEECESDMAIPYEESRYFSDDRLMFESNNVIPVMEQNYTFYAQANYNSDGSIYNIELKWHRDSDMEQYSHLAVTIGYEEVPQIKDCIEIEVDDKGNVIEPGVTVTERDGVQIVAVGNEDRDKTVTFQNDSGWYQIEGSWKDSYEEVIALLDWFWEHPIDFTDFQMEKGDRITGSDLLEHPEAFAEYLPAFEKLGLVYDVSSIELKNDEPDYLEVHYVSNATEEQVENGDYVVGENGCERVHWCIDASPSENNLNSIVRLEDLSKEQVTSLEPVDEVTTEMKIQFVQKDCVVTIYTTDVELVWKLIEMIK